MTLVREVHPLGLPVLSVCQTGVPARTAGRRCRAQVAFMPALSLGRALGGRASLLAAGEHVGAQHLLEHLQHLLGGGGAGGLGTRRVGHAAAGRLALCLQQPLC